MKEPNKPQDPYLSVKHWKDFQHYRKRNPPWIKLYVRLLDADDMLYSCLHDASKLHLIHLWLLASRHDNKIPCNHVWLQRRMNITEPLDLQSLVSAGFVTVHGGSLACCYSDACTMLASCKQNSIPETETETEKKPHTRIRAGCVDGKSKEITDEGFLEFWNAYPKRRRTSKPKALALWKKLDSDTQTKIIEHVTARAKTEDWTKDDGQYATGADVFLRNRRWEDEVDLSPATSTNGGDYPNPMFQHRNPTPEEMELLSQP